MKIIPSSLWTIFLVLIFAPEISSSELKGADDQAPQFLFVLHARHGKYMPQGGDLEVLQFPKKRISAVEMFSNRFQNVRSEFRQPQVRGLWKLRDINFKKSVTVPRAYLSDETGAQWDLGNQNIPGKVIHKIERFMILLMILIRIRYF